MIWKLASVLSLALCVVAHEATSEQKVILKNTEHTGHHGELVHIGSHEPEHHEEYAWSYPSYEFSYQVNDPHTHDHKGQHEVREGDVVKGEYWLEEPDGRKRTVKYHADKHSGFNAHVEYSAPHHHVHFKTHKHLEHKPVIEHHEEPVIKHIPIIEHHHEEEHKPVIKHIPVIAHHHHEIKHHHEEKHRPLIKHIPVIDHHHEIKHHHEHKPYIHIKPVLEDHHEEHIPILLHKPVIEHHHKKLVPIYLPKPVHHHYQPLIVHKHEHKPILEHHDIHHDHHVPWVHPKHHGHHDDHHQPILRRLQENYLRDQHSRFYRSY